MAFPRRRLVVCLLLAAAAVTVAYWAAWYGHRSWVASRTESSYEDFENAFPLADGWLVVTLLVAARGLLLRRPSALLGLLCAGSAGLYLAGMDVL
jgi:cell division protein FtsX